MKGQALSPKVEAERRRKISEKMRGNKRSIDPITGKHFNDHRTEFSCEICGTTFLRSRAHIAAHNFCSRKCSGVWNGQRALGKFRPTSQVLDLKCIQCGTEYKKLKSQHHAKHGGFCSVPCHNQWRSEHKSGEQHYHWKGGHDPWYGPSWKAARRAAWNRDNRTCQRCLKTTTDMGKNPDVHHVVPFRKFGRERHLEANALSNLICLCNKCHQIVEHETERKEQQDAITNS